MKSDFRIDLSHFLLHSDMKQFFSVESQSSRPICVGLSMFLFLLYSLCSSLTSDDLGIE